MMQIDRSTVYLAHGECLAMMQGIPDNSVDMVLCDLPYGTTACKWDTCIDLTRLWEQYKRICKPGAAIVLTAAQPFTSVLVMSNPRMLRDEWIWQKNVGTNFANAKRQPLREHESVIVFADGATCYNPIGRERIAKNITRRTTVHQSGNQHGFGMKPTLRKYGDEPKNPGTVVAFDVVPHSTKLLHPTQKPIALMEYMVKTYTNEGMTVLDNCMGSGTTGVACVRTGRNFLGIEQDPAYFEIAKKRIQESVYTNGEDEK